MTQRLLLGPLLGLALACGGAARSPTPPPRPSLPEGDGVYLLRHNPIPCAPDGPDLRLELQSAVGWERVSVEDADPDQPLIEGLLAEMSQPGAPPRWVEGRISRRTRRWSGGHVARVLVVRALDPPREPEE